MRILDEKVAVITGAGSGMGKASCKVFAREGAKVVAADISGAEQDTASEVGPDVLPVHCDVTREADVEALMATAEATFQKVDASSTWRGSPTAACWPTSTWSSTTGSWTSTSVGSC
jgi:NAD(P)-dependent dehydrogenase (short-subunit alcohol dehydrogenase family)